MTFNSLTLEEKIKAWINQEESILHQVKLKQTF